MPEGGEGYASNYNIAELTTSCRTTLAFAIGSFKKRRNTGGIFKTLCAGLICSILTEGPIARHNEGGVMLGLAAGFENVRVFPEIRVLTPNDPLHTLKKLGRD